MGANLQDAPVLSHIPGFGASYLVLSSHLLPALRCYLALRDKDIRCNQGYAGSWSASLLVDE